MHPYSNNLSTIAKNIALIISEVILACFSSSNRLFLLQSSLGSDGKNVVFEIPEAEPLY